MADDRKNEIARFYDSLQSGNKFLSKRSIFAIGSALGDNEPIHTILAGWWKNGSAALCCSDRQLVFIRKPLIGRLVTEAYRFERITSVERSSLFGFGRLLVHTGGNSTTISQVDTADLTAFMQVLDEARHGKGAADVTHAGAGAATAELERLSALFNRGHLTEAEFAQAKARALQF